MVRSLTSRYNFGVAPLNQTEILLIGGQVENAPLIGTYVFNVKTERLRRVAF
jgi:hypothetical protein